MPILIPGYVSKQRRAVEYAKHARTVSKEMIRELTETATQFVQMEQSILAQAFRGEL